MGGDEPWAGGGQSRRRRITRDTTLRAFLFPSPSRVKTHGWFQGANEEKKNKFCVIRAKEVDRRDSGTRNTSARLVPRT